MAPGTGRFEYRHAAPEITVCRVQPGEPLSFHFGADRDPGREKREVRDDVTHVAAGRVQGLSVHAAAEAVVDAVFDQVDFAAARTVLRESRVAANPGHRSGLQAVVEMTAGAAERVADVAGKTVPG